MKYPDRTNEDVHGNEGTGHAGNAGVEEHHEEDRDPPQPLEVRPVPCPFARHGRHYGTEPGRVAERCVPTCASGAASADTCL